MVSDLRFAVRSLFKRPAFSLAVVAVLTLGIGLNAAVFTMLKGLALSPISGVSGSARLTVIYTETSAGRVARVSYPDYQYIRDHDRAFSALFASGALQGNLGRGRNARPIWGEIVTGNYFEVLGVRAQIGRTLLPSDDLAPNRHPVVVISDGFWRRDFNADPEVVGRTIEINNFLLTVVGVADPAFHGTIVGYDVEAFVPVMMAGQVGYAPGSPGTSAAGRPAAGVLADPRAPLVVPQGRLRPGVSVASAAAQVDALWAARLRDRPIEDAALRLRVVPFWQSPNGGQAYMLPAMIVLSAMGLLVLMIACANIAGLVLVRGISRRGEIAVRLALGATRARILRLLVLENLVIAAPGAILGPLVAWWGVPMLLGYGYALAAPMRLFLNIEIDSLVIGFSILVACGCALVFGFVPALQSSRIDLVSAINEDASPRGGARGRLRSALVVAQVSVSLLLLVGAGLVTRSLDAARHTYPGFDARHVTSITIDVRQNAYDEPHGRVFYRQLLDKARADPRLESASLAAVNPMMFMDNRAQRIVIEGHQPRRGEDLSFASNTIGPDYFRTLRIPLNAGREFEDRDDARGAAVAIVNTTFAQRFWGSAANAVNRRLRVGDGGWRTVVGVAADVKYMQINEAPRPYVYLPFLQEYRSSMILHTRGAAPVTLLVEQARAHVAAVDAELPIIYARSLGDVTQAALIIFQFMATMLFVFGIAGMVLAGTGTYGLVAYTVKQRTREIGIRMALGASGTSVVREFLGRGLRLGAIGAGLGLLAALGATRLLRSMLFGVSVTDGVTFARAGAIVIGGVLLATLIPAWRASRTDPLKALRHQ